jgi:hypothetical protein
MFQPVRPRYLLEKCSLEPDRLLVGKYGEGMGVDGACTLVCALLRTVLGVLQPGVLAVFLFHPVAHHMSDEGLACEDGAACTSRIDLKQIQVFNSLLCAF